MSLHYLSLLDLSAKLRSGALSPVEVTETILDRISALAHHLVLFCIGNNVKPERRHRLTVAAVCDRRTN